MADIRIATKQKKLIKLCVWLLRKKLGEDGSKEKIHDDIKNCGNDAICFINELIINSANKIMCDHQKNTIIDFTELGLWIMAYKDTAYRDWFFSAMDDMLKPQNVEKLRKLIKPYVKPSDKWHVNLWIESKKITNEKKESGQILDGQKSEAESIFVPAMLQKKLSKIINYEIKR